MKILYVAFCVVVFTSSVVRAQTGGELFAACQHLENNMRKIGDAVLMPTTRDANQCGGFLEAVQQYSTLADHSGKTFLNSCPPVSGINTSEVLHIFNDYARKPAEKLNIIAAAVAYNAMADAFPCK